MQFTFGDYTIKTHELDQKLSVQVTSELGEVLLNDDDKRTSDFPNEVCFYIKNPTHKPEAKGLKKFIFGDYTFILGINYAGELFLFHSVKLTIGKKRIDGKDTLTLAFLKDLNSK
ncbi:hypothetical protein PF327_05510 [Sulfurovum sp. XTW-4]|uniref:Uncharacterized protein n=1 Tax=Sulfurovum xiamenensis TaxID=3019066 RepID=A0ABT7QRI3_9BACT|nr:hypothetical protein [Sulfurovum xiamenensis]MDM5263651.1 hypothetical protein [Sulfurovum xiamenensis]